MSSYSGTTLQSELNRLANGGSTLPTTQDKWRDETGAANSWAGTSGLTLIEALNAKAGNSLAYQLRGLNAVCNQLAGTTGLEARDALAAYSVFSSDGSSLSGWTLTGAGGPVTVDSTPALGNPQPSYKLDPTGGGSGLYRDIGVAYTSVAFDFALSNPSNGLFEFRFACNATGAGGALRVDGRPASVSGATNDVGSGSRVWTTNGLSANSGTVLTLSANTIYRLAVSLAGNTCTATVAGGIYASPTTLGTSEAFTYRGNYLGFWSDAGTTSGNIDNIVVI